MNHEGSRRITPRRYYLGAALLVLVGLVIGLGLSAGFNWQWVSKAEKAGGLSTSTSTGAVPESPFVSVVDKALPAVVFIDVRKNVESGANSDDPQDELFRRFFGDQPKRQQRVPSSGSGFLVDDQGHILTNNHVVSNASDISVTLNDKRTFKATRLAGQTGNPDIPFLQKAICLGE